MNRRVMIELTENTTELEGIEGFELDQNYGPIDIVKRGDAENTVVVRGILTDDHAIQKIESLPQFHAMYHDGPLGPASIPNDEGVRKPMIEGDVEEHSERGEFELLLMCLKSEGENVELYEKWLDKWKAGPMMPKPVFQKLKKQLGTSYYLEKTEEAMKILETIQDTSRIKMN